MTERRPRSQRSVELLANASLLLALVPVVLLPQLMGGVHPEAAVGFAATELLALVGWWTGRAVAGRSFRVSFLVLPFVVGAVTTALQVQSLPLDVLDLLQADTAGLRRFVTAGLPEGVRHSVLSVTSMDPPETKAALLRLLGAGALFVVVADAAQDKRRARLVWRTVLTAGAAVIVVAVGHAVFNVPGAWGQFSRLGGVLFAPIVNPNHLSKVLAAFSLLALGRSFSVRDRREALVAAVVGLACGVGVPLTMSRGGVLAYGLGLIVWAALFLRARAEAGDDDDGRTGVRTPPPRFALPALAVSAVLFVVLGTVVITDDALVTEMATLEEDAAHVEGSKLAIVMPALSLVPQHAVAGVGNNAFAVAFTGVSVAGTLYDDELTFSHVENIVVATLVEHGAIVGGALLIIALFIARHLLTGLRTLRTIAAVPAVIVLVGGDLVDFALETGAGIALMATALALCASMVPTSSLRLKWPLAVGVVAVATVLVAAHGPGAIRDWHYRSDRELAVTALKHRTDRLYAAMAARPFDGHTASLLATDARQRHQPTEALAWANRALNLWPTLTAANLEAARALAATGHLDQAMLHYRAAADGDGGKSIVALREALGRTTDVRLRERALPDRALARFTLCRTLEKEGRLDDAIACADVLAARVDATTLHRLESLRLALLRPTLDDTDLRRRVAEVLARGPPDGEVAVQLARALLHLEGRPAALAMSSTWLATMGDARPLLQWQLNEHSAAGNLDDARATLQRLRPMARTPADRDRFDRLEADLHGRAGDHGQRLLVIERLAARHPDDAELLALQGLAEVAAGKTGGALLTLKRIHDMNGKGPTVRAFEKAMGMDAR